MGISALYTTLVVPTLPQDDLQNDDLSLMEESEITSIQEVAGQKSIGLPNMTITVVDTTPPTLPQDDLKNDDLSQVSPATGNDASDVTNVNTMTVPNVTSASKRVAEVGGGGLKERINERKVRLFY